MNLIYLLLRSSWLTVAIAIFTGLLSGTCSTWLIALINTAISSNNLVWLFFGLILVVPITGLISQIWLIRLGQKVIFDLIAIVISHADRYFHLGSRIIKLDYGKVEYDKYKV